MKPIIDILEGKITAAMVAATGEKSCAAIVRPATDPKFGDYQVNGIMALAKKFKANPRQLAEKVLSNLDISDICEKPEIAGPGFINLKIKPSFVAGAILTINSDSSDRLGTEKTSKPKRIVVDFSGPNIAKQMHVGHLRSTIIGDCICRLLEFQGHTVIRQNHIGDWGLQMGAVINARIEQFDDVQYQNLQTLRKAYSSMIQKSDKYPEFKKAFEERFSNILHTDLDQLENHYREAVEREKKDPNVANNNRRRTADLQSGDHVARYFWEQAREITLNACFEIYSKLGGVFGKEDIRGESFYKNMLKDVVEELKEKGLAVESEGAMCVFPPGFKDKEGKPLPLIVQKSDGAYLYATTDLAAIRYRVDKLKADKIIYVTDARQSLHFQMVFAVAKMAGWISEKVELAHVTFGSVLGEDGKPFKTREGENVKLADLLDEAKEKAETIVNEKNPDLPVEQKRRIAEVVGIGAVKYADYTNNRTSDYVFSFDKMLAMDGSTAPYMQYAYARVQSIDRKAQERGINITTAAINLTEPAELDLAKHLVRYGEAIESAKVDYRPNYLTSYLYELAQKFSVFYTNCPVLNASEEKRYTRWLLCDLTAKTIKHGLKELLGIEVVEQM